MGLSFFRSESAIISRNMHFVSVCLYELVIRALMMGNQSQTINVTCRRKTMNIIEMFDAAVVVLNNLEGEQFALKREIKLIIANQELEIPGELEGAEMRLAIVERKLARHREIYDGMVRDHSQHVWVYARVCNEQELARLLDQLNGLCLRLGNGEVHTLDSL